MEATVRIVFEACSHSMSRRCVNLPRCQLATEASTPNHVDWTRRRLDLSEANRRL